MPKPRCLFAILFLAAAPLAFAQDAPADANIATPAGRIRVPKDFRVELLYSVPAKEQGSWINLCQDGKGRIIVSDQYGGLYRFPAPPPGSPLDPGAIEKVPAKIQAGNGLLWAFDSLYVGVSDYENNKNSGLYRVTDSDGDDQLDKVEKLRSITARGDHGVHAVLLAPDGKSIFLVCGNGCSPLETNTSSVPLIYGEDHLLPRMPDGRGFMRDVLAPGGTIYRVSPDGKQWDRFASGFRNIFDAAFNQEGELFTWDADMEYDFNTSWYRPTRVCHVVSGAEYGWRNGAGKRPVFYADNLPPVLNIGPGSPTGVTFGYGAHFPAKYQQAMFIADWSWGKLYAIHLTPNGASYRAEKEEFLSGAPLPLTDMIINPADGAMYFTIGGRKVQSGLYRLTYQGSEPSVPAPSDPVPGAKERSLRHQLEAFHLDPEPQAVDFAWAHLSSPDRFLRWAARTALEHQPLERWAERALAETDVARQTEALLGLVRAGGIDPQHRKPSDPPLYLALKAKLLEALTKLQPAGEEQQRTWIRTLEIFFVRFGPPEDADAQKLIARLDPLFPAASQESNWLLCETLAFLQAPGTAAKGMALLQKAPTQEEQIEYARSLRMLKTGWTSELHTAYFEWFLRAANYRGGASFEKFIEFIRRDAVASLNETEKQELAQVLEKKAARQSPVQAAAATLAGRTQITPWTLDELSAAAEQGLKGRSFENGRKMFGAVGCFICHRFGNDGGMTGPDLTGAGGRYSPRDLLDQIINPSKEINEQFVPSVLTRKNGTTVIGTIVNLKGANVTVNTDPSDPNQKESVERTEVLSIEPSKVSLMPPGLLNILTKEEILDLVAYILSGGDSSNPYFQKP